VKRKSPSQFFELVEYSLGRGENLQALECLGITREKGNRGKKSERGKIVCPGKDEGK